MLTILLHSSKTMRSKSLDHSDYQKPLYLDEAEELALYLKTLSIPDISKSMQLSEPMAAKTKLLIDLWSDHKTGALPAIDAFLGDIYSGLQSASFSSADRSYAQDHLIILSGLYGGLRALDSVKPYRLEMAYKLPDTRYVNLVKFWGDKIAMLIPGDGPIINVSAAEYTKAVLPYVDQSRVIAPKFMTVSPKTGQPLFVVVHAKIARGAFARWLIQNRIQDVLRIAEFDLLGYKYDQALSSPNEPVYVCKSFQGIGLSVRLT